ncbi:MAG: ABC transporter permease subunit [Gammaproteobacteria bacterium]|nr:ABC transporter permease subunit [Gammaproteobacteria bacterium]
MRKLINWRPAKGALAALGCAPFVLVLIAYMVASQARLEVNPNDKMLPAFASFSAAITRVAIEPDRRTGERLLWVDTAASLRRLGLAIAISAVIGLTLGMALGALPIAGASLSPLVAGVSLIPPLAILPILFIVVGLGELSKVVLICIGITPVITRDIEQRVREIPRELIVKAQTLGASTWQIMLRVVLPQALPRLVSALRLGLCSAWLFLIAAEAIAAESGLGYRIFLVRRYLAMDVILPYVLWITAVAYLTDYVLGWISRRAFRWHFLGQLQ